MGFSHEKVLRGDSMRRLFVSTRKRHICALFVSALLSVLLVACGGSDDGGGRYLVPHGGVVLVLEEERVERRAAG